MPTFVRVKDPVSGHEVTVSSDIAAANGLPVIDKPAVDSAGAPLRPLHALIPPKSPIKTVES
jgi:hypothetical protein